METQSAVVSLQQRENNKTTSISLQEITWNFFTLH
jgi:hypothetical protein